MSDTLMRDADIWLHDFQQVRSVQLQQVKEYRIEKFLQGSVQMSFALELNDPKLAFIHEDQLVYADGTYWYVDHIEDTHPGHKNIVCNARHIAELTWRIRFGNYSLLAQTPADGLDNILKTSGWTVGTVPADIQRYTIEEIDASVLSLLRRWAVVTGYELLFDDVLRTVSLVTAVGTNRQIGFRWGYSLKEVTRTYFPPQATRLYPVGANNLSINNVNPLGLAYIEDYSFYEAQGLTPIEARALYRKDLAWVDERYLLAVNLYDAAVARLAKLSQPRVFYAAKVLDLNSLMGGTYGYEPGDTTVVDDEELGVLENVRVTRVLRFPRDPRKDEVELGFQTNGLLDISSGATREVDYSSVFMIVDVNEDPVTVGPTTSNYNSIALTSAGEASIIAGSTFVGTASGSGIIEWRMVIDGTVQGKEYSKSFVNGDLVEFSWPSHATGIPEGAHVIDWRAQIVSGSGTVGLDINAGRSWVLSRGAVGIGVNSSPNAFISDNFFDADIGVASLTDHYLLELMTTPIAPVLAELTETPSEEVVTITATVRTPFQLENPVFGQLDSVYSLSGPDSPSDIGYGPYHPPGGGASGGSNNYGPFSSPPPVPWAVISGGTVTTPGDGWVYHTFTASGSLVVTSDGKVDYCVVGGGGSGNGGISSVNYGAAGAGGDVRTGTVDGLVNLPSGTIPITVGNGAPAGQGNLQGTTPGTQGGTSSIGTYVTALGGNGVAQSSRTGGSNSLHIGETRNTGTDCGGGAGAGENGGNDGAGQGGDGYLWDNGTTYGGGGGSVAAGVASIGGTGGGGSGSISGAGGGGTDGLGGGGGGGTATGGGGAGGKGIVIVRVPV